MRFLGSCLVLAACASSVSVTGGLGPLRAPGLAVAIFYSEAVAPGTTKAMGESMVACVADGIRERMPTLRIVPADEFARHVFPELEPTAAPLGQESLATLAADPVFRQRAAETGVGYLITVEGQTTETSSGPMRGGIVLLEVRDRTSVMTARVYDLRAPGAAGTISAEVSGRPFFGVGQIPPFFYFSPSFTETRACRKLGSAVGEFLGGPAGAAQ